MLTFEYMILRRRLWAYGHMIVSYIGEPMILSSCMENVYEWMDPPQIDPSSTIDRSQIDRPWFDRESTLHRSRIDPGSTQKRSRIDPGSKQDLEFELTADRSWIDPESTLDRLKSDPVGPWIEINPSIYRPKNIDHCCLYELLIVCL